MPFDDRRAAVEEHVEAHGGFVGHLLDHAAVDVDGGLDVLVAEASLDLGQRQPGGVAHRDVGVPQPVGSGVAPRSVSPSAATILGQRRSRNELMFQGLAPGHSWPAVGEGEH